jgi:hypothetical protein
MSFGFAVGDFVALGRLSGSLYKQCKGASAEFAAVCNEVLSIDTALRELEDQAQNEDSILNHAGKERQKELNNIVQNCTEVLQELEAMVTRYRSLVSSQEKVWDRIKFGNEGIEVIRNRLLLHTPTLTLFLTTLGTESLGRVEKKLDEIAAEIRAGQHEPSVITVVNDKACSSQNEAWAFLFRELAGDFSIYEIEAYRGVTKGYISQLVERGALEEQATSVCSDEGTSHRSTPRLLSPASSVVDPTHSSPAAAELPEIRWPPKPTAASETESERPADEVEPSYTRLQAIWEQSPNSVHGGLGKGVCHNPETTNSIHRSAEAPPAQLNATFPPVHRGQR